MTTDMFLVSLLQIRVFFIHDLSDHRVCNKNNTTGITRGAGTANPFRPTEFTSVFFCRSHVAQSVVLCIAL